MRLLIAALVLLASDSATAQVLISEIADLGSTGACTGGADWLELHNSGTTAVDLAGYKLHDDNGPTDPTAFTFPSQMLAPNEYLLLCSGAADGPAFRIGGDDTITLLSPTNEVLSSVELPDTDRAFDITYALNATDGTYLYTTTPTPGAANVLTPIVVETPQDVKDRLAAQNALGTRFFGMDGQGLKVADAYDDVLDLYITMETADYDYLLKNQSFESYVPFTSARLATKANEELAVLTSPGRIRPKGQSTLYFGTCFGSPTIPFQLEFTTVNETQTLFGVEKLYLRNHLSDTSYMRDWASHRMLARFGLPHLRARKVNFFINGEKKGFYTLLEAPDQEYVFARNFPSFDVSNHALFKVKTFAIGCGSYTELQLAEARARVNDTSTPPYAFERGEHRPLTPVLGFERAAECSAGFITNILNTEFADVVLAYVREGEQCGPMLVKEGLVDRDLGEKEWEDAMADFIDEHLADNACDPGCTNSNLATQVNMENFLKNFAVYAVTINGDSPMGNGNNYYLADAGDGTGWNIQQYDHNNIAAGLLCDPQVCSGHLPDWSILRPTCGSLESNQIVGPILTDPILHAEYVEYVRDFIDTVLGDESFIDELVQHGMAIQQDVTEDFWSSGGVFFPAELSTNASDWNAYQTSDSGFDITTQPPFIPILLARVDSVRKQLDAYDAGTFPRGPHLPQDVEFYEQCVDWQSTGPPPSACYQSCYYDGCAAQGGLAFPAVCDEATAACFLTDFDPQCAGVPDGEKYEGMADREDGSPTFCFTTEGFPAKVSTCPPPPAGSGDGSTVGSTSTSSAFQNFPSALLVSLLSIVGGFVYMA